VHSAWTGVVPPSKLVRLGLAEGWSLAYFNLACSVFPAWLPQHYWDFRTGNLFDDSWGWSALHAMLIDLVSPTPLGLVSICDALVSAVLCDVTRCSLRLRRNIHDFILSALWSSWLDDRDRVRYSSEGNQRKVTSKKPMLELPSLAKPITLRGIPIPRKLEDARNLQLEIDIVSRDRIFEIY
jgi:hypothetical protein